MSTSVEHDSQHLHLTYLGADVEIIHSKGAHERHLTVSVGVNTTGYHQLPTTINDSDTTWHLQVESNTLDVLVLDVDICSLSSILIDHLPTFDQNPESKYCNKLDKPPPPLLLCRSLNHCKF